MTLKGKDFVQKRFLLLNYLYEQGAFAHTSAVKGPDVRESIGVNEEDFLSLYLNLHQAELIGGRPDGILWLTNPGLKEIRAQDRPDEYEPRRAIPSSLKEQVLEESRHQCAICSSHAFLELTHIVPHAQGGGGTRENLMILCPTCHMAVDSSRTPVEVLREIKRDWIDKGIPGKGKILGIVQGLDVTSERPSEGKTTMLTDLISWAKALQSSEEFDACVQSIAEELSKIKSEDDFIANILKPLFDALGYEGVTVLHHTGTPEHGKDIVFYERDRLGGFTFYAVVACAGKVHAKSSKAQTHDPGHYAKMLDQIEKCFALPYSDPNLKGNLYVDKVIVACSDSIADEALQLFRAWEDKERRRLIFLDSSRIAGHKLRLQRQDILKRPA
jgi:hypothetical protein